MYEFGGVKFYLFERKINSQKLAGRINVRLLVLF